MVGYLVATAGDIARGRRLWRGDAARHVTVRIAETETRIVQLHTIPIFSVATSRSVLLRDPDAIASTFVVGAVGPVSARPQYSFNARRMEAAGVESQRLFLPTASLVYQRNLHISSRQRSSWWTSSGCSNFSSVSTSASDPVQRQSVISSYYAYLEPTLRGTQVRCGLNNAMRFEQFSILNPQDVHDKSYNRYTHHRRVAELVRLSLAFDPGAFVLWCADNVDRDAVTTPKPRVCRHRRALGQPNQVVASPLPAIRATSTHRAFQ